MLSCHISATQIQNKIHDEANYEIGSLSEWLDPLNMQQSLLTRWGPKYLYAWVGVLVE